MFPHTNFPEEYRNGGLLALVYFLANLIINYLTEDETLESILSALVAIVITVLVPFVKIAYERIFARFSDKYRIDKGLEKTNKLLSSTNPSQQEKGTGDETQEKLLIRILEEQQKMLAELKKTE